MLTPGMELCVAFRVLDCGVIPRAPKERGDVCWTFRQIFTSLASSFPKVFHRRNLLHEAFARFVVVRPLGHRDAISIAKALHQFDGSQAEAGVTLPTTLEVVII